jgi:hypothetical protein
VESGHPYHGLVKGEKGANIVLTINAFRKNELER